MTSLRLRVLRPRLLFLSGCVLVSAFSGCKAPGGSLSAVLGAADALDSLEVPRGYRRVTLVAINDLHGNIDQKEATLGKEPIGRTPDGQPKFLSTRIGGVEWTAAYFDIIRAENPEGSLFFDAGDDFQGTAVSNAYQGRPVVLAMKFLGIQAATFGNHEFDFGPAKPLSLGGVSLPVAPENLKDLQGSTRELIALAASEPRPFPYLSANVLEPSVSSPAPFAGVAPTKMFDIPLDGSDPLASTPRKDGTPQTLKVGVIGATTMTLPKTGTKDFVANLRMLDLETSVRNASQKLRANGAQLVVLLVHAGGRCVMSMRQDDPKACLKLQEDEVTPLLARLDRGTVDVVLAGHMHAPQANIINGVRVLQTTGFDRSFSRVDLVVKTDANAWAPPEQRILNAVMSRPTYVCSEHFANYPSCAPDELENGGSYPADFGPAVPATYRGHLVRPESKIESADRASLLERINAFREAVPKLSKTIRLPVPLSFTRKAESPAAACVADAMLSGANSAELRAQPADLMLHFSGGIRDSIPAGELTFDTLQAVQPFDTQVFEATLSGSQLTELVAAMSTSEKSVPIVSEGWQMTIDRRGGASKLLRLTWNGQEVASKAQVRVLMPGYTATGLAARFGPKPISGRMLRDVLATGLIDQPLPASCARYAISPETRRIVLVSE